ncbi:MAG TPA: hypothetical protein DCO79_08890 [Spirochaeta sp.]|nr:hypothetical protein [Spirochaeta sp.]
MNSFQLCYNRGYTDEKALTWKKTGNYRHNSVNSTASWGKAKTDVLSQRESLDNTKIYDSFQRDSKVLEIKYREFILRKIREYENPA